MAEPFEFNPNQLGDFNKPNKPTLSTHVHYTDNYDIVPVTLRILGSLNGMVVGYDDDSEGSSSTLYFLVKAVDSSNMLVVYCEHNIFTFTKLDPIDYYRQLAVLLNSENLSNFGFNTVDELLDEVSVKFAPKGSSSNIPDNSMLAVLMRLTGATIKTGQEAATVILGDEIGGYFKALLEIMSNELFNLDSGRGDRENNFKELLEGYLDKAPSPALTEDLLTNYRSIFISDILESTSSVSNLYYNPTVPNTIFDISDDSETKGSFMNTVLSTEVLDPPTKMLSHILTGSGLDADVATKDLADKISNKIVQARKFNIENTVDHYKQLSKVIKGEFSKYFTIFKKIANMADV